jgi:transposase
MNKGIRFTDEFKRDAMAQVVERGYAVIEVAEQLGITTKSLYTWKPQFSKPTRVRDAELDLAAEPNGLPLRHHARRNRYILVMSPEPG